MTLDSRLLSELPTCFSRKTQRARHSIGEVGCKTDFLKNDEFKGFDQTFFISTHIDQATYNFSAFYMVKGGENNDLMSVYIFLFAEALIFNFSFSKLMAILML